MLSVNLQAVGKKFSREWIFRNVNFAINSGEKVVILGGNGSGKSTLLQIISGYVTPNEGKVIHTLETKPLEAAQVYKHIAFASPYLQLSEELTGMELVVHLARFKKYAGGLTAPQVMDLALLNHAAHKHIRNYSSGMKQRLKLALAILSDAPLLLLDEPASNLDKEGIAWYTQMIDRFASEKTVVVCSNDLPYEFSFCGRELRVTDYKIKA